MKQAVLFPALQTPSQDHEIDNAFGEIRALLSAPPSEDIWLALWELLEAAPDDLLLEAYIPYVKEHITHWPDGLRAAPNSLKAFFFATDTKRKKKAQTPKIQACLALIDGLHISPNQTFGSAELLALAHNPLCRSLTSLQIYGELYSRESIKAFAQSPHLQGLTSLGLRGKPDANFAFNQPMLEAFDASPWFRQLQSLTLDRCEAVFDYAEAPPSDFCMPRLSSLYLQESDIDGLLAVWLSASTPPPIADLTLDRSLAPQLLARLISDEGSCRLRSLTCKNTYSMLSGNVLGALAQVKTFPALETLHLEHIYPLPGELQEFLGEKDFPRLTSLGLFALGQGTSMGAILRDAGFIQQLHSLRIHFDDMGPQGLRRWLQKGPFEALEELELRGSCGTEESLQALLQSRAFPHMKTLRLDSNQLGKQAGTPLAMPHQCNELTDLDVSSNPLGDELLLLVLENPSTPGLERLRCVSCAMSIPGLYALLTAEQAPLALRRAALLDRLENCTLSGLQEFLSDQGFTNAHRLSKDRAVSILHQAIKTPAQIQHFLCHRGHTSKLSGAAQKATLRALGVKGYSKLSAVALRRLFETTLRKWKGELPEIDLHKLRKKLTPKSK